MAANYSIVMQPVELIRSTSLVIDMLVKNNEKNYTDKARLLNNSLELKNKEKGNFTAFYCMDSNFPEYAAGRPFNTRMGNLAEYAARFSTCTTLKFYFAGSL